MAVPTTMCDGGFMETLQQAAKRAQELDSCGYSDTVVGGGLNLGRYGDVLLRKPMKPGEKLFNSPAKKIIVDDLVDELPDGLLDELGANAGHSGDW